MAITKVTRNLLSTGIDDQSNATAITIDSSENVGINTTSPFSPLHISKTDWSSGSPYGTVATIEGNNVNDANWGHLIITDTTTSNGNGGSIRFATGSTSSLNPIAGIQGVAEGTSYGGVGIYTRPSGGTATERMRIDSSGNVGIGTTTTFSNPLTLNKAAGAAGSLNNQIALTHTGASTAYHIKTIRAASTDEPAGLAFVENATERMRIDSSGRLLHGTASPIEIGRLGILFNGGNSVGIDLKTTSADGYLQRFFDSGGTNQGNIYLATNGTVSFNNLSDYRTKENVEYNWDATTRLKQLKPARFNFIQDTSNTVVDGFLAHEVEDIVPEAISGTKDATEELTNVVINNLGNVIARDIEESDWIAGKQDETYPSDSTWEATHTANVYQGIDQSKLVPLLVKTIQELEERITTLENA